MTFDEFKKLPDDEQWNVFQDALVRSTDALARIDVADSRIAKLLSDHSTAIAALIAEKDQIVGNATTATSAALAESVAALSAAVDPLNAKVAELTQTIAERDATIAALGSTIAAYDAEAILPVVKAKIKAARIAAAQKRKADAIAARVAADAEITALG